MRPEEFVAHLSKQRASAILRTPLADAAGPALEAAIRGGFQIVEVTLNTPGALAHIKALSKREDVTVGAGTVLTLKDARDAVAAGARFLVSPVVDEAVIDEARKLGVAAMPGCATPTEFLRAHRAGAPMQKFFPAPTDLANTIKVLHGPMPFLRIVPTSGVDGKNVAACLAAGAHAVGFVGALFIHEDLAEGRFDRIEERARMLLSQTRS